MHYRYQRLLWCCVRCNTCTGIRNRRTLRLIVPLRRAVEWQRLMWYPDAIEVLVFEINLTWRSGWETRFCGWDGGDVFGVTTKTFQDDSKWENDLIYEAVNMQSILILSIIAVGTGGTCGTCGTRGTRGIFFFWSLGSLLAAVIFAVIGRVKAWPFKNYGDGRKDALRRAFTFWTDCGSSLAEAFP